MELKHYRSLGKLPGILPAVRSLTVVFLLLVTVLVSAGHARSAIPLDAQNLTMVRSATSAGPSLKTSPEEPAPGIDSPTWTASSAGAYAYIVAYLGSDQLCHFHAPTNGSASTTLTVINYGTTVLMADISVTAGGSWLSVIGGPSIQVQPGGGMLVLPVAMSATGLTEGIYTGEIRIDHNAESNVNPMFLAIEFRVDNDYMCADTVILRTAVASPGVLQLKISSDGRHGYSNYAGLYRDTDGSWSLYDGTLVLAYGAQTPDTTTYFHVYGPGGGDPGARGFIAKSALIVDTSAYGTGSGNATVTYSMQTKDEVLDIGVAWYFPQDPDSADFVLARYVVKNISGSPISNVVVGQYDDFDVTPGTLFTSYQDAVHNHGHYVPEDNLIYQFGYTIPGMATNPPLGLAERYSAGVAYLAGRDYAGLGLPFQNTQVALRGGTGDLRGFTPLFFGGAVSGYLYDKLVGSANVTIWEGMPDADSSSDLFTYMCLDQGLSLAPGQAQSYVIAFVCDTLTHPDMPPKHAALAGLAEVVDMAAAWATNYGIFESCACPNQGDIEPDGFLTALDLSACIDVLFAGDPDIQDEGCPSPRFDLDCDGFSTALDLSILIDHLFAGGAGPCDACAK